MNGRVAAETPLHGATPDGRHPGNRRILADGPARHIQLLQAHPDLGYRAGAGPS